MLVFFSGQEYLVDLCARSTFAVSLHFFFSLFILPFRSPLQLQSIWIGMMHSHRSIRQNVTLFMYYLQLYDANNNNNESTTYEQKNSTENYNDIIFIVIYLTFGNYRRSVLTINLNINTALIHVRNSFSASLWLLVLVCRRAQVSAVHMKSEKSRTIWFMLIYVVSVSKNDS